MTGGCIEGLESPNRLKSKDRHARVSVGDADGAHRRATSFMTECGGKPAFTDAGRTLERQIVMSGDPLTLDELLEQNPVETTWAAIIDVLDAGLLA